VIVPKHWFFNDWRAWNGGASSGEMALQQFKDGFDFVLEDATVQALPESVRPRAIRAIAELVGPGGALLAIARARRDDEPARELPPFTLLRAELESFGDFGLTVVRLDLADELHWLGEYARV